MIFKTITVVGANGTMGYNACAIFAAFGNAKVFMISRDIQKSRNAVDKAVKAVRAESIRCHLIPCDYSHLEDCVKQSDLVFESVSEDFNVKKDITKRIGEVANLNTIIATGTSGLSINLIAKVLPKELQKNYLGIHFFNPPYSMPLLELVPNDSFDSDKIIEIKKYFEEILLRKTIVCKDKPAFAANRIGFMFLNLALQYAEKYKDKGGIMYIDSILGPFTGRAMAPCATVDFVGLDVHAAIVDNLLKNTSDAKNESFVLPSYVEKLISEGRLGKKTNGGLYKTELSDDGEKKRYIYDIANNRYVPAKRINIDFANNMVELLKNGDYQLAFDSLLNDKSEEAKICIYFLKNYIEYSIFVAEEVCGNIACADDAMANGFNWCPPLALSNALFGTNYPTQYDYRSYFKAVK